MNDVAIKNIDKIIEMYNRGDTALEIGKDYGLSEQMSWNMLNVFKKIGVISCEHERERKGKIKEQKLKETEERNMNIVDDYKNSISVEDIEKKYKVSYQLIRKVLDGGMVGLNRRWYDLKYPLNLIRDIFGEIDFEVSEDTIKGLNFSINTLSEREANILDEYYENKLSLREIAKIFTLTGSRIQQIRDKSLRKLRHPSRSNYIKFGYEGYTEIVNNKKKEFKNVLNNERIEDNKIEELDLSVRAYNCLKRSGINKVSDIKNMMQLMTMRNCGRKTSKEIMNKLKEIGYEIPEDESEVM